MLFIIELFVNVVLVIVDIGKQSKAVPKGMAVSGRFFWQMMPENCLEI
jgi:hypothetical protein